MTAKEIESSGITSGMKKILSAVINYYHPKTNQINKPTPKRNNKSNNTVKKTGSDGKHQSLLDLGFKRKIDEIL